MSEPLLNGVDMDNRPLDKYCKLKVKGKRWLSLSYSKARSVSNQALSL